MVALDFIADTPVEAPAATQAAPGHALALSDIWLAFGGVHALRGVDFDVAPGEIHALIGPNGAGKSSLVNVIAGVYRPDRGTVAFGGARFAASPIDSLARLGVARTFQNLALFPGLSAIENIALGRTAVETAGPVAQTLGLGRARRERAEALAEARDLAGFLRLESVLDRPVSTLPFGLQKRVELARALIARPKLLLLDEPLAGVGALDRREMAAFVRAARDRTGAAVVLIEHDIGVVMSLSDRITVLDHGRRIAVGPPALVQADQNVIDAYLGVPHEDEDET